MTFKETSYYQKHKGKKTSNETVEMDDYELTSLEGMPTKVDGSVYLADNDLSSLKGISREITEDCSLSGNASLKTLEHSPKKVNGQFAVSRVSLKSLKGMPEYIGRDFLLYEGNYTREWLLEELSKYSKVIKGAVTYDVDNDKQYITRSDIEDYRKNNVKMKKKLGSFGKFLDL